MKTEWEGNTNRTGNCHLLVPWKTKTMKESKGRRVTIVHKAMKQELLKYTFNNQYRDTYCRGRSTVFM